MESTLSFSITRNLAVFTISKALNLHFSKKFQSSQCIRTRTFASVSGKTPFFVSLVPSSSSSSLTRSLCAVLPLKIRRRVECVSSTASSFGTGGGCSGGDIGSGGGGDGGSGGGDSKSKLSGGGFEEVSASSSEVIILDVGGMTCGGCAASVKKILESQPQVSSATVNLTTETAIVWPVSEAKVIPNWQKQLGEALARHLTNYGFNSNLRG